VIWLEAKDLYLAVCIIVNVSSSVSVYGNKIRQKKKKKKKGEKFIEAQKKK